MGLMREMGLILHLIFKPAKKAGSEVPPAPAPPANENNEQTHEVRRVQLEKDVSPDLTLRRTIIDEVVVKKEGK